MGKKIDLTGQRFGRWRAIYRCESKRGSDGRSLIYWHCLCDCGNEKDVPASKLRNGESRSCGCWMRETNAKAHYKHGMKESRLYGVYCGMIQRCGDPNSKEFVFYGERGIGVCEEWRRDFKAFHAWAVANGYNERADRGECTLDRIDVDGDYCPENCRWISMRQQNRNRRSNVIVELNGEKKPLCDWCEELNLPYQTIWQRLKVLHWDAERAFFTPTK